MDSSGKNVEADAVEADAVEARERERRRIIEAEAAEFEAAEARRMDRTEAMARAKDIDAEWDAEVRRRDAVALARARKLAQPARVKLKPGYLETPLRGRPRVEVEPALTEAEDPAVETARRAAEKDRNFTIMNGDLLKDHYLTADHITKSYGGVAFLNCMGKTFNILYTCTWESMYVRGCSDEKVAADIDRHMDHLSRFFRYRGEKMFFAYVVERGTNRGLHVHALLHVPERLRGLERAVEQSLWTIFRERPRRPAKRLKGADPSATVDDTRTVDFQNNTTFELQWRRWRYMFEGIDENITVPVPGRPSWDTVSVRDYFRLEKMSHQGRYMSRRFGWSSKLLGEKAQGEFEAKYGKMPNALLYPDNSGNPAIPVELYGSQYFDWWETNVKGRDFSVKLLSSLGI